MATILYPRCLLLPLGIMVSLLAAPAMAAMSEIVSLAGQGQYRAQVRDAWQEAHLKQALAPGHFVRTGDYASMAILLADRTQMRLAANSMLQIKEIADSGETRLELSAGRAWTQAKRRPTATPVQATTLTIDTPNATAAIRGTDWEMEVDPAGQTRLTVLHGAVEFYNDLGSVTVRKNEQAVAEQGKAPVKLLLQNPAERVQWVTSYVVDPARYADLRQALDPAGALDVSVDLLTKQQMAAAHDRLLRLASAPQPVAGVALLLLADFAIYGGQLGEAEALLWQGRQRFASDLRLAAYFTAQLARVALYRGDSPAAQEQVQTGMARFAANAELQLAAGEIARFNGEAKPAAAAYTAAIKLAPQDARGWSGLGAVENEREELKQARPHLQQALALDAGTPGARGELATLETFANHLDAARRHYDLALQAHPDDYVALTGLGLLQLKSGQPQQALDSLLRATVIEPKYARAVVYTAVAYYQLGRPPLALETLARASELDRHDPLPHQLASLIHTDLVEPGRALDAAREALRLMPYLKSLNQLANDQKGAANLGNALAQFGLEDWALNYAQQSYNPFWAGSHLFLADRYDGKFAKQSELMQGYLTDPTAFGASNRFQSLLPTPSHYFSASATPAGSRDLGTSTASFIANGYANNALPLAYFVEGMDIRLTPGAQSFSGDGSTVTAALGAALSEDLGVFAFVSSFAAGVDVQVNPFLANRTTGRENRLDLGANYKFGPTSQSWLKLGLGEENARNDLTDRQHGRTISTRFDLHPRNRELQFRHSLAHDDDEWTWGAEQARTDNDNVLTSVSSLTQIRNDASDVDQSWSLYLADRHQAGRRWTFDGGLFYQHYDKSSRHVTTVSQSGLSFADDGRDDYPRRGLYPRLGLAYSPTAGEVWRLAYQHWLRPNAANTLSPVATAGIVLDDQAVLPGGRLERLRGQFEREWNANTFTTFFVDVKRIENIGQPGNVLNQSEAIANLDRLRNRVALVFQNNGEALEQAPVFLQGRSASVGGAVNQRLSDTLSSYANYVYSDSANTHDWFAGLALPYLPRHHLTLGGTWIGLPRLMLQAAVVYRSRRFSNEENTSLLAAGWDAAAKLNWQSVDKHWLVEAYAMNMLKKDAATTVGANAVWRY